MVLHFRMIFLGLGLLGTVNACAVATPAVAPLPSTPPPSTTGTRRPDLDHPSPYEHKMDEEEQQYRRQRGVQEQEQERAYQQWQQEREHARDPRYEWMR
jgi:hypothetical protein